MTGYHGLIWIVFNSEDTQGVANSVNAEGCKAVCDARIEAQADMLYGTLHEQARLLRKDDPIVMHQGGGTIFGKGAAHFVAAGIVAEEAHLLTPQIASGYPNLWNKTKEWYKHWPATPAQITDELFLRYQLKHAKQYMPRPKVIRPLPQRFGGKSKFLPIHSNCTNHPECSVYLAVIAWWQKVIQDP